MDEQLSLAWRLRAENDLERIAAADLIVFDKTDALTRQVPCRVHYPSCSAPGTTSFCLAACIEGAFTAWLEQLWTGKITWPQARDEFTQEVKYVIAQVFVPRLTTRSALAQLTSFLMTRDYPFRDDLTDCSIILCPGTKETYCSNLYCVYEEDAATTITAPCLVLSVWLCWLATQENVAANVARSWVLMTMWLPDSAPRISVVC